MDKRQKQVVLAVLGVGVVAVYGRALFGGSGRPPAQYDEPDEPVAYVQHTSKETTPTAPVEPLPQEWGRNPFIPVGRGQAAGTVTMIAIGSEGSGSAMIDGRLVHPGDRIPGGRIVAILPQSVIVERGNKRYELRLGAQTTAERPGIQ